jgi:hypothetical protein
VSYFVKRLGDQYGAGGAVYQGNFQYMRNLIDWSLEDTDLLQIRGSGAFARTLTPLSEEQKSTWEVAIYVVVFVALIGVVAFARAGRRRTRPIELPAEPVS